MPKIGELADLPSTDSDDEQILTEPRNQKAYLVRVGSFTVRTWFAKPLSLSPMICARYGWKNTDVDMLQCVSCKAVLCAKLPNSSNQESYKKFCNKLKSSLSSSHEKLCPWPSNPSSELFMTIDIHNKDSIINGFCERVHKLLQLDDDKLPNISLETCERAETLPDFWDVLPVAYADKYLQSNQQEVLKKAVPLALCGWIVRSKSCDLLVCEYCQRQIGLWNYVRVASSPNMNGHFVPKTPEPANTRKRKKVGSPPEKRIKLSVKETLDPVAEHRNWCPWVNVEACYVAAELDMEINLLNEAYNSQDAAAVESSCNGSTVSYPQSKKVAAAWEESCSILSTHFNICDPNEPKKVSPFDRLRHVRSLLNLWSSPEPPPSKSMFILETPENDKVASSLSNKLAASPSTEVLLSKASLTISKKTTPPLAASPPSTPQMTRTAKILTPIIMQKLTPPPSASASVPTVSKTPPSKTPSPSGKSGGPRAAVTPPMQGKTATTTATTAVASPQHGGMATRSTSHPHMSPVSTRSNTNQNTNSPGHTPNVPEHRGVVTRTTAQRACQQNFQTRQQKWRWTK